MRKWVYLFSELDEVMEHTRCNWEVVSMLLGDWGANLADMQRIGIPVSPGFTVTSEACNAYLAAGGVFPDGMWDQELRALMNIEKQSGKTFGGQDNPLILSCSASSKVLVPGMMDSLVNIGINDVIAHRLIALTGDPRFVYDSYRRLIQSFGLVVMGISKKPFVDAIEKTMWEAGVSSDLEIQADDWLALTTKFKTIFRSHTQVDFPQDPFEQLKMATEAMFKGWNEKHAVDYRNAAGISHDQGTAINIVAMVFGNLGDDSAVGIAMTRNSDTGEPNLQGEYIVNAQVEDLIAGVRETQDIGRMEQEMPKCFQELQEVAHFLEDHYRDMQDIEFTIERGKLWILQSLEGKRTAQAAVRIAVDLAKEGRIDRETAVLRVQPEHVDFFLHPQFGTEATSSGRLLARGLNVSPGAAVGQVAFDADMAETWAKNEGKQLIMVRPETKPADVHGMLAAQGILTSRGGRTSHTALVARQFGKPAVVGASSLSIDLAKRQMTIGNHTVQEGDWLSIDGTAGIVYGGRLETMVPDIKDPWLIELLAWADEIRTLGIWVNADYPLDAQRALEYGAQGIGLCRSEQMLFETERLPLFQKMIMTDYPVERREALAALLPFQREDFAGLFRVMDGLPVIIRLIDAPLHVFLPHILELINELNDLGMRVQHASTKTEFNSLLKEIRAKESIRNQAEMLQEQNPMMGMRGVRLGIEIPELFIMQVRAILEAACEVTREGIKVYPKIMIPMVSHTNELKLQRELLEKEAKTVIAEQGIDIEYKFGTMIEFPRSALAADKFAEYAQFFSFDTDILTQTAYGISRHDAESRFLITYMNRGIWPDNPFTTLDREGVAELMRVAIVKGRQVHDSLECGICGEHSSDPDSIAICHELGLDYVSCSPFRVPVARLSAAQAALRQHKVAEDNYIPCGF